MSFHSKGELSLFTVYSVACVLLIYDQRKTELQTMIPMMQMPDWPCTPSEGTVSASKMR